jgi:hypothetical protein
MIPILLTQYHILLLVVGSTITCFYFLPAYNALTFYLEAPPPLEEAYPYASLCEFQGGKQQVKGQLQQLLHDLLVLPLTSEFSLLQKLSLLQLHSLNHLG